MDPWATSYGNVIEADCNKHLEHSQTFEDDFIPLVSDTLPDSKEYLAILESKLHKIKSDSNVLKQLAEKREACMQQLLSGLSGCEETDLSLDEPVQNSTLLRTLAPEKQALTQGELVDLIKYDQLVNEAAEPESANQESSDTEMKEF